jgi:hypothetical protein
MLPAVLHFLAAPTLGANAGRQGRQPVTSYRSESNRPLPLGAGIGAKKIKLFTDRGTRSRCASAARSQARRITFLAWSVCHTIEYWSRSSQECNLCRFTNIAVPIAIWSLKR